MLTTFNEGLLSPGFSVAVSAHLEYCEPCRKRVATQQAELASDWLQGESEAASLQLPELAQLLDRITSQPQEFEEQPARTMELQIAGRRAVVPRVLARLAEQGVNWRSIGGGLKSARLKLDREANCDFLYMQPDTKGITHTHRGNEVMVVLEGSFEDELGEYGLGDFVMRNPEHTHTPGSKEGCICFAALDSPLHFTAGLACLLNPLQPFLFRRQLRQNT
jgi:putative transcriptional regulator